MSLFRCLRACVAVASLHSACTECTRFSRGRGHTTTESGWVSGVPSLHPPLPGNLWTERLLHWSLSGNVYPVQGYLDSKRLRRQERRRGLMHRGEEAPRLWVRHRPGRARLGMGLGAIGAFAPVSGSDSSDEYRDRLHHGTVATGHGGLGSLHRCSHTCSSRLSVEVQGYLTVKKAPPP